MDCYKILSLDPDAPVSRIHAQYRRLAVAEHPARGHTDPHAARKAFRDLGEAYDILRNSISRKVYDEFGYDGLTNRFNSLPDQPHGYRYHGDPMRTFEEHFGTSNPYAHIYEPFDAAHDYHYYQAIFRAREKAQLPPLIIGLDMTLEEIFHGNIREVEFSRNILLPTGDLVEQAVIKDVIIRPGCPDGTQFIFPQEGHQARNFISADAVVQIEQLPHDRFFRDGDDLRIEIEVDLLVALCGGDISLNSIDDTPVRIEEIGVIRPGSARMIPGMGMPRVDDASRRGNLYLDYKVVFPKDLDLVRREMIANALKERADKALVPTTLIGVSGYTRTPTLVAPKRRYQAAARAKTIQPIQEENPANSDQNNYDFITEDINVSQESLY
ncbi:dnaJ homolog subfamily B member 13-like [Paramacrobiotus metropolitanus]|uniref:dnaJ homolog subfamily B member 13-like n=1 Tax=Paramacrobiotus metropolitanus TaxID=2943436 RepID=UPI0024457257|nr:dnaJ homolog subfamily B member 13-like [Paramacrobiotus metropolitanus]